MKQTDRVPHKARGADEKRAGVPAESAGTAKTSYPLMKYLSLLLAVALLFSGVTFARYLSNDRIDSSVGIAAFDATYSVDRVNTTTFGNENYWTETGTAGKIATGAGTAITVGITLKNNGDTSVQPTLHLEGPKEYWDNIALQLTTARDVAAGEVLTPQLVIKNIVDAPEGGFDTTPSKDTDDFGSLGGDATLKLSGNIDAEGGRTATWTYGEGVENKMTITKKTGSTIDYSVGFVRQSEDDFLPPIYVDCRKTTDIYCIDLELPALEVAAAESADGNRTAAEQRVVVWLTWTTGAPNNSQAATEEFWKSLAESAESFPVESRNGDDASVETITILGYHFDQSGVPVTNENGMPTGETTTVRIKKTLGSDTLDYFHVASINDNDGAYTHTFGERKEVTVDGATKTIAQCLNQDEGARMYVDLTKFVSADYNVTDAISVSTIRWEEDSEQSFQYAPVHERSFGISFKATFVQSSEVP